MEGNKSQKQIIRATGIVGGGQLLSILLGFLRTKLVAVLLGPSGVGFMGILQSVADLVRSGTGFGINYSGVKDIAESYASNNVDQLSETVVIVRRWALATGVLGMVITVLFCVPLSKYSFGNEDYAGHIAFSSIILLITSVSSGHLVLLQGLRLMGKMTKAVLWGALLGTATALPMYWYLGFEGIVIGLILTALSGLIPSCWFIRNIKIVRSYVSLKRTFFGGLSMARLGFSIVVTGLLSTFTLYAVRAQILGKLDIDAVGNFQAAWMIGNIYLGIVLNAMLADFFPRLSGIIGDRASANRLINEQIEVALLVASPLLVSLIAFAELIITLLYSSSFSDAPLLLQWQMVGSFFVLVSWPLGVSFLAKGKGLLNVLTDGTWSLIYLVIVYFGWDYFGFVVLGLSYVVSSFVKVFIVFCLKFQFDDFSFSRENIKYMIVYGVIIGLMFLNVHLIDNWMRFVLNGFLIILSIFYSYNRVVRILGLNDLISRILR